ncbi:hypothetical protein CRM22_005141 [Opisthorchis felineus]|uniref:Uncharacterized protein n=1 Tax=Opisthorchis felineus TaxID=147828 RepID=A0A4S2LZA4_OPIFE|nr:hypothetical protein CRM22_005141 [Opisthorchis felineus]
MTWRSFHSGQPTFSLLVNSLSISVSLCNLLSQRFVIASIDLSEIAIPDAPLLVYFCSPCDRSPISRCFRKPAVSIVLNFEFR